MFDGGVPNGHPRKTVIAAGAAIWGALGLLCASACATSHCAVRETRPSTVLPIPSPESVPAAIEPSTARPGGQAVNAWDEDLPRKLQLETDGEVVASEHVVIWFPKGAFTREEAGKLIAEFQRGIIAAKTQIGRPNWSFQGDRRVYYYLPDAQFVAHAPGGNCAFIPLWRAKERKAPWLHESLHLLLKSEKGDWLAGDDETAELRMPLWLYEGLADALAIDISSAEGLDYYSPLIDVPADQLDALAASSLREVPSLEVVAAIGGRGKLRGLFGPERIKFAVPFYNGSASFVRYIAGRHGYGPLLAAIEEFGREHEMLERATGESIEAMKAAWLRAIQY